jgi:hypothetical protein
MDYDMLLIDDQLVYYENMKQKMKMVIEMILMGLVVRLMMDY